MPLVIRAPVVALVYRCVIQGKIIACCMGIVRSFARPVPFRGNVQPLPRFSVGHVPGFWRRLAVAFACGLPLIPSNMSPSDGTLRNRLH